MQAKDIPGCVPSEREGAAMGWLTAEEWEPQADAWARYMRALAARVADEFEARCFRLGRDRGPVCQFCDEPMAVILDRQTSGSAAFVGDGVVTVDDWRVPVCAGHAEAFGA